MATENEEIRKWNPSKPKISYMVSIHQKRPCALGDETYIEETCKFVFRNREEANVFADKAFNTTIHPAEITIELINEANLEQTSSLRIK